LFAFPRTTFRPGFGYTLSWERDRRFNKNHVDGNPGQAITLLKIEAGQKVSVETGMRIDRANHLQILDTSDSAREGAVLSKAAVRAADFFDIPDRSLAKILGLSTASISRMRKGEYLLSPDTKPFELAQLFVRLFRSLDSIMGGDDAASRSWMRTHNTVLNAKPIEFIKTVAGLATVLQYVDSRRAPL
jgi:uncharacterized protein (DUF2384 family)